MKSFILLICALLGLFAAGCKPDLIELRARNLGSEGIGEARCNFAGNSFQWGWLTKNADKRAVFFGKVRYKGANCEVEFKRANGELIKKSINVSDQVAWLKKNCKGKEGVRVIFYFFPEKETVEIEVSCRD